MCVFYTLCFIFQFCFSKFCFTLLFGIIVLYIYLFFAVFPFTYLYHALKVLFLRKKWYVAEEQNCTCILSP